MILLPILLIALVLFIVLFVTIGNSVHHSMVKQDNTCHKYGYGTFENFLEQVERTKPENDGVWRGSFFSKDAYIHAEIIRFRMEDGKWHGMILWGHHYVRFLNWKYQNTPRKVDLRRKDDLWS